MYNQSFTLILSLEIGIKHVCLATVYFHYDMKSLNSWKCGYNFNGRRRLPERKAKAYVNIEPRKHLLGLHLQFKPTSYTK